MCGLAVDAALGDEDLMRGLAVDTDRWGVGGMGGGAYGAGGHAATNCSVELVLKV